MLKKFFIISIIMISSPTLASPTDSLVWKVQSVPRCYGCTRPSNSFEDRYRKWSDRRHDGYIYTNPNSRPRDLYNEFQHFRSYQGPHPEYECVNCAVRP